jgi:hypothetical protein
MITLPGSALRISLSRTISVTDLNAVAWTLKQDPQQTEHIKHSKQNAGLHNSTSIMYSQMRERCTPFT